VVRSSSSNSRGVVAIATCAEVAGRDEDDLLLIEALGNRGIDAVHAVWDDPSVDWSSFSLAVIRSTWDYPERRDEFLTRMARARKVLNALSVLRWNTDKRYLDDLARAGLPVVPTRFLEPRDQFVPPREPYVIKPAISCGAKNSARYRGDDEAAARDHVRRLQAEGRTVMVQPYLSQVEKEGEVAVIFIGGTYTHSIRRGALLKHPGLVHKGETVPLNVVPYEATREERTLAERAIARVPGDPSGLLYARVDLIPGSDGRPVILEVELTEPSLFLSFGVDAVERLAAAIKSTLADE
jgi:glutathione synthase/RimK-type ligase-like ATP-grasp enzyme